MILEQESKKKYCKTPWHILERNDWKTKSLRRGLEQWIECTIQYVNDQAITRLCSFDSYRSRKVMYLGKIHTFDVIAA